MRTLFTGTARRAVALSIVGVLAVGGLVALNASRSSSNSAGSSATPVASVAGAAAPSGVVPAGCVADRQMLATGHPALYISSPPPAIGPDSGPPVACFTVPAGPVDICANMIGYSSLDVNYVFDGVAGSSANPSGVGCAVINVTAATHTLTSPQLPGQSLTVVGT